MVADPSNRPIGRLCAQCRVPCNRGARNENKEGLLKMISTSGLKEELLSGKFPKIYFNINVTTGKLL